MPAPLRIAPGSPLYPALLGERLGAGAPPTLLAIGSCRLLSAPLLAVLASARVPSDLVLPALELARELGERRVPVVSGFQSPLEHDTLDLLLAGGAPVVACPARGLAGMRLPPRWSHAIDAGRLLLLSRAPERRRRADSRLADARNRMVAALAARVLVIHATPGGRLHRLAREVAARGQPLLCLAHPANRDLVLLGAREAADARALA